MPKQEWIKSVLIIGSGPIVIGQAAEFDYSGSQACIALREEGVRTIVVNSNPATIQTDFEIADVVYIEPLTPEVIAEILKKERPDAILPTMGGQTGLNIAVRLAECGILDELGVRVIGTPIEAIKRAEDRRLFYEMIRSLGEPIPRSIDVGSFEEAADAVRELGGFPVLCRASYALGGTGSGVARNLDELRRLINRALMVSMNRMVSIDEYLEGWKEYELEVIRDSADNCITVCPMENLDPLGIHTGESIVVAPAQTLTDEEYQTLRRVAFKVVRAVGVVGACNIQFAVNPESFEYAIIEVNPRVSRSSALASKATGYPIARIAAKIALGYNLDEIKNKVVGTVTAAMEPTVDYVVVKIPRWPVDIFDTMDQQIGTMMKSTGEAMGIGRTFEEALQKAVCSLELERYGLYTDLKDWSVDRIRDILTRPTWERIFAIAAAFHMGMDVEEVHRLTRIDRWFLNSVKSIVEMERTLMRASLDDPEVLREAKRMGFSDRHIAALTGLTEDDVRRLRKSLGILPTFKMVDTCAGEFEATTPYYYSTYEEADESRADTGGRRVVIVGSGPIRIGQGIEFDYCSVHAALSLKEEGVEPVIINNNPETVSTDFDVSARLYFEPITFEHVMNIVERERPEGVILQLGGQTPLKLAKRLEAAGVSILGTSSESIDVTEDRERFRAFLSSLGMTQPLGHAVKGVEEAVNTAASIGYPVLVRPSYVLGGRAMSIVWSEEELRRYIDDAISASEGKPILIDKYLYPAVEVDVDALSDGEDVFICGVLEHIELAGVHSGDAAMVIPPRSLSQKALERIKEYTKALALNLKVLGLINIQYAVMGDEVYVLEVNARASRTVPFLSKVINVPIAKVATKLMMGRRLRELNLPAEASHPFVAVKESVFSFSKLPAVDPMLEPRMKSTGECMGIGRTFEEAYWKAELAANNPIPLEGCVLLAAEGAEILEASITSELKSMGYRLLLLCVDDDCRELAEKIGAENVSGHLFMDEVDAAVELRKRGVVMVVDLGWWRRTSVGDVGYMLRRAAVMTGIPYITTPQGISAALKAARWARSTNTSYMSLNELQCCSTSYLRFSTQ